MMVAMKRAKWDGSTTGSRLAASVAKVHDELKVMEWLRLWTVETSLSGGLESSYDSDAARACYRDGGGLCMLIASVMICIYIVLDAMSMDGNGVYIGIGALLQNRAPLKS